MPDLRPLVGRTLVLVAHADDEAVAFGALLQRMREPLVVICTDGAPTDRYFWQSHGTRERYAALRAREAARAMDAVGVRRCELLSQLDAAGRFVDQHLFRNIPAAMHLLGDIAGRYRPEAILTLAYEGGHPDHDTCNFLARQLALESALPVWEAPLYWRDASGEVVHGRFLRASGEELTIDITSEELARKRTMFAAYASQAPVLAEFDLTRELVRPMIAYDYSRPPHAGTLNYEAWGWPIRGWELCDQFTQYLNTGHERVDYVRKTIA